MQVTVRFQRYLAGLLGCSDLPVNLASDANVAGLLDSLRKVPEIAEKLFRGNDLDYSYQLACNGRLLHGKSDLNRPLRDGDEVYVFLTLGGG